VKFQDEVNAVFLLLPCGEGATEAKPQGIEEQKKLIRFVILPFRCQDEYSYSGAVKNDIDGTVQLVRKTRYRCANGA